MRLSFTRVVGQASAKRALLLAATQPLLAGVLLRGDKGSAKTTLARGLAALLPGDAPFVELPLGATEERVIGSLDLTALLERGEPRWRPGLLAAAHGGVLYVDEINLLADHLVDVLLDVAASGVNRVERDGFSHAHAARFVLVASMNPEEGELRPQLLDRFGLAVDVTGLQSVADRTEAVRRQLRAESTVPEPSPTDPPATPAVLSAIADLSAGGRTRPGSETAGRGQIGQRGQNGGDRLAARASTEGLREELARARTRLAAVPDDVIEAAARLALAVGAEGLRADLMLCRAAAAGAALDGRAEATLDDVRSVADLVLGHRRRRRPFDQPGISPSELDAAWDSATAPPTPEPGAGEPSGMQADTDIRPAPDRGDRHRARGDDETRDPEGADDRGATRGDATSAGDGSGDRPAGPGDEREEEPGAPAGLALPAPPRRGPTTASDGRAGVSSGTRGRYIRDGAHDGSASTPIDARATAIAATIRLGAGNPQHRGSRPPHRAVRVTAEDVRGSVREQRTGTLVVFVVDASGSMGVEARMAATKAAILGLLGDAYRRRGRVALITFRGDGAEVVLRPTGSVEIAKARLAGLATGGTTPLAAGLDAATAVIGGSTGDRALAATVVLVTDGRATAGGPVPFDDARSAMERLARTHAQVLVIDTESGATRLGLARELAVIARADYRHLDDLGRDGIEHWLRTR